MEPEQIMDKIAGLIKEYLSSQKQDSFLQYKDPFELREILKLDEYKDGAEWSQIFTWIEKYLVYSVKTNHAGFVNRMWVGANLPSILGEMVAAVSNTSSCTYESAPVSTLMEKYMLQEMLDLVGFKNGEGQMTTGSSNANMLAMMAARNESLPAVKTKGIFGQRDLFAFVSADAHYSMEKAANILGLGTTHLIKIPVNNKGEMDIDLLEELFIDPDPDHITEELIGFFKKYPIPMDDFPLLEGTYSRTILCRNDNGYEAMAARWSPGTISSIHGHPHFALIIVIKGKLGIDYYKKHDGRIEMTRSGFLSESQFFSDIGQAETFDNHIHGVQAYEETLSIHISSDDAAKGEIFE